MGLFLLLAFFCIVYCAQKILFSKQWNKNLEVNLHFEDPIVREGTTTCLIETITNQKWFPLPILHAKMALPRSFRFPVTNNSAVTDCYHRHDIFSVGRNEKLVRKLQFTCTKRGFYRISSLTYFSKDYLLEDTFGESKSIQEYIYVTPKKMLPMDVPIEVRGLIGNTVSEKVMFEDPFEFKGIRSYQPYDNYRSINWKTSARQQALQVNTHFSTYTCELFFVLNLTPRKLAESTEILEKSISIVSTLASHFLHQRVPVGFTTNGLDTETKRMITMNTGQGSHHEQNIDLKLARIQLPGPCESLRKCIPCIPDKQHTQVIFISASQNDDALAAFDEMEKRSEHAVWILPIVSDEIEDVAHIIRPKNGTMLKWKVNVYGA